MQEMLKRVAPDTADRERRGTELVERAKALAPMIAGAAGRIEKDREIPADVLNAMHDARLFRMLVPRSIGGEEVEPKIFFQVMEAVAGADASVAWCLGQNSGVSMAAAYLDPKVAYELFGDPRTTVATGAPSPGAKAIVTDGGYRVTGHWHFASGSRHSHWLGGHATICELDGSPRLGPNGKPLEQRTMFFHKSKAKITDTWQVIGLRGTGSDDYEVKDLFVPEAYSFTRESDADRRETGTLYRFSIYNMFGMAFCAVALGIARAVLTDFITLAKRKTPHSQIVAGAEQPHPDQYRPVGGGAWRGAYLCARLLRQAVRAGVDGPAHLLLPARRRPRRDLLCDSAGARGGRLRLSRRRRHRGVRTESLRAALPRPAHMHPAEPGAHDQFRGAGTDPARHRAGAEAVMP